MKTTTAVLGLVLAVVLFGRTILADTSQGDTSNGATDFTFHGKGQWWHNTGGASELTTFSGPFDNAAGHPAQVYMTFWKEPDANARDGLSPALDAKSIQILHSLGTTFYYPTKETPPPDPATLGYTADDFANADKIFSKFPQIGDIFPKGLTVSGCHKEGAQYFLIQGKESTGVFLVYLAAKNQSIDIAVLPTKVLSGSFESILDNLNYFSSGGMNEIMEFGGYYYYLSRLPQSSKFDPSISGTTAKVCPATPVATDKGIEYPQSWIDATKSLGKQ